MGRTDAYRQELRELPPDRWRRYLAEHSNLPGPRGNLELAWAVAEEAPQEVVRAYAADDDEYLALCGAIGLGRMAASGDAAAPGRLRELAGDGRWRVREGVAMGLQRLGDADPGRLIDLCGEWLETGSLLVDRAVVAGVCEPRLLAGPLPIERVLAMLDVVTARVAATPADERRRDDFRVLRQALGYCWSVAVAAAPDAGFTHFERWADADDRDVRWVVRQNLGKSRMERADPQRWAGLSSRFG